MNLMSRVQILRGLDPGRLEQLIKVIQIENYNQSDVIV